MLHASIRVDSTPDTARTRIADPPRNAAHILYISDTVEHTNQNLTHRPAATRHIYSTVRDGAIEIGSWRSVGPISESGE